MGDVGAVGDVVGVIHHTYYSIVLINKRVIKDYELGFYYFFVSIDVSNLYFEFLNFIYPLYKF